MATNEIEPDISKDLTVSGYIRNAQTLLSSPLNIVAKDIYSIILSYVLATYNGTYEWNINKDLMYKMFVAKSKQKFSSPQFEIGGITWQVFAFPNGANNRDLGSFKLFISPISVPFAPEWNKIITFAGFYCPETLSGDVTIFTFNKNRSNHQQLQYKFYQSKNGSMLLDDIKYRLTNKLTIQINIKILKIICNSDNVYYENNKLLLNKIKLNKKIKLKWQINNKLMTEMKYSYLRKCFVSKLFNNMWYLKIYPSGHSCEKNVKIELQLCALPKDVTSINVNGVINIRNWIKTSFEHQFSYANSIKDCGNLLTFKGFKSCDELIIDVNIEIVNIQTQKCRNRNTNNKISEFSNPNINQSQKQIISNLENQMDDIKQKMIDSLNAIEMRRMNDMNTITNYCNQLTQQISTIYNNQQIYETNIKFLMDKINNNNNEINKLKTMIEYKNDIQNNIHNEMNVSEINEINEHDIIKKWLCDVVKLNEYFPLFLENGYDNIESIMDMNEIDLEQIGVHKIGHRKKIIKYKNKIRQTFKQFIPSVFVI